MMQYKNIVKPIYDSKRDEMLQRIFPEHFCKKDVAFNFLERKQSVDSLVKKILIRFEAYFSNLANFKHIYILNGNTDYINLVFLNFKNLTNFKDDYRYYQILKSTEDKMVRKNHILSYPSWQFGDDRNVQRALLLPDTALHLDVAYLDLIKDWQQVDSQKFETLSISLSKTLAIPYNRISIMFSKSEIEHLKIMNVLGYVNLSAVGIADALVEQLAGDYWIQNYWTQYLKVCHEKNWKPTNCVLFALDENLNKVSTSELLSVYVR